MSKPVDYKDFDDLLDAYLVEVEKPNLEQMNEWIKNYPSFGQELAEFTANWFLIDYYSAPEDLSWESIESQNKKIVNKLFSNYKKVPVSHEKNITSSIASIWLALDMSAQHVANSVDITVTLLTKLNKRSLEYLTIPLQLIERLATKLKLELLSLAHYLNSPAVLSNDASYKSNTAPIVHQKENFFDAVRNDQEMTVSMRRMWLTLEPPGNGQKTE